MPRKAVAPPLPAGHEPPLFSSWNRAHRGAYRRGFHAAGTGEPCPYEDHRKPSGRLSWSRSFIRTWEDGHAAGMAWQAAQPPQRDLFGGTRMLFRAKAYPGAPGSGPPGVRCKHCKWMVVNQKKARYFKCGMVDWTLGAATDIRANSPACHLFQPK